MLKRPGKLLPVFFLSLFPVAVKGQYMVPESTTAALGGTFVTRSSFMVASQNQAGLGWAEHHSLGIQHSRPFMELGISALAARAKTRKGSLGSVLSSCGIRGLRHTSLWISYGMKLSPQLSAGLGMQVQSFSIPGQAFYHPELDLALGIQLRISDHWGLGTHISSENSRQDLCISAGCAYSFFQSATLYAECHIRTGQRIQFSQGLEWAIPNRLSLMLGISNLPLTWSAGLLVLHKQWGIHLAFQYVAESGSIPYTSLHYAW
jgi:hypothetical protein